MREQFYFYLICGYGIFIWDVTLKYWFVILYIQVSTHARVTALQLADHGYLVIVGTEDGHVLTFRYILCLS